MVNDDERLFARFCEHGDVAALGELFDRTSAPLLRVALHLTRDAAVAEDLVQATFLRAIEVRAQWDPTRAVLPWLCGLLHNRARHDRWQRGRAPDPQRLARSEPATPPDAAARAEFDAAVDAAIAGMAEVYRPVLRLHLAYGHAPAEIAHALERPAATVRSQLARGLALLRSVLPAGFAGGAALLLASGRGLAAVKQAVVAHGAAVSAPLAAAAVSFGPGVSLGGMAMGKKVGVALGALVLAVGGWGLLRALAGDDVAPSARGAPVVAVSAAPRAEPTATAPSPPRSDARPADPVAERAATGSLRIVCRYDDGDAPAWDVAVAVRPGGGGADAAFLQRTARPDAGGVAFVEGLRAGPAGVVADRGGSVRCAVVAGASTDVELRIPRGVHVRGRVVDAAGAPVRGAQVWLSDHASSLVDGSFVATTDANGGFALRSVEPRRFLSATLAGHRSAVVKPVDGAAGSTTEIELRLRGRGTALVGTVRTPDGAPAAGARVLVGNRQTTIGWSPVWHANYQPPLETAVAADGTFAVHGQAPGTPQALWVRAPGCCLWHRTVELLADVDTHVAVELTRGATVAGVVTTTGGAPVANAYVAHRSSAWSAGAHFDTPFWGPDWANTGAPTDANGRYRIDCIAPGTLRLRAHDEQFFADARLDVTEGQVATWNPVFEDVALQGRVVDERGAPIAGVEVDAAAPRGQGSFASEVTDAHGRFTCRRLARVSYVLRVSAPGARGRPLLTRFGVVPPAGDLELRVPDAAWPRATVTGRVVDVDGQPARDAEVRASSAGCPSEPTAKVAADGSFRLGPLRGGTWRVQASVTAGERSWRGPWSEPFVLRDGVHDLGTLRLPATGSVAVTVVDERGPTSRGLVALEDSTGWSEATWLGSMLTNGRTTLQDVAPGAYRVKVIANGAPTTYAPVTVDPGRCTEVTVRLPKGVAVQLAYASPTEGAPIHVHFVWRRDGELFERYWNHFEGSGEIVAPQTLLAGTWEVTATSETGKAATTRFVLADGDPPGRRITIAMP